MRFMGGSERRMRICIPCCKAPRKTSHCVDVDAKPRRGLTMLRVWAAEKHVMTPLTISGFASAAAALSSALLECP